MSYVFYLPALAIIAAVVLELLFGNSRWLPHPAPMMRRFIAHGERALLTGDPAADLGRGALLAIGVIAIAAVAAFAVIAIAASISELLGVAAAIVVAWMTLSLRSVDDAAHKVQRGLATRNLDAARATMAALTGRDPDSLDPDAMIRATVESVAGNTSAGAIAPLFFLFLGGPVFSVAYRAIDTLSSMIGRGDDRHQCFGRAAARIGDVANFIPTRITGLCIAAAASTMLLRGRASLATCLDEAREHGGLNPGWPEAAMAGALGVRLNGPAVYAGEVIARATFGRDAVPLAIETIAAAREVMRTAVFIALCALAIARYALSLLF
jgi:adenosylcobinamide-phosphate synthase